MVVGKRALHTAFALSAAGAILLFGRTAEATPSACDGVSGNLVSNCGFETGDFTNWTRSGNLDDTSIVSGEPFFVHTGTFGLDEGPVSSDGFISQTLTTTPGTNYHISAWFNPCGCGTVSDFDIEWNGVTLLDVLNAPALGWTNEKVSAIGTGSDSLTISFRNDPGFSGIDDISTVAGGASVPEPASLAIFGSALAGFAAIRRRRRRKAA